MSKIFDEREAHKFSALHRESLLKSDTCYCFFCLRSFRPDEIVEWCDDANTAICPKCSVDSVIGDFDLVITSDLLEKMKKSWFW